MNKRVKLYSRYYIRHEKKNRRGDYFWAKQAEGETDEDHWKKLDWEKNANFYITVTTFSYPKKGHQQPTKIGRKIDGNRVIEKSKTLKQNKTKIIGKKQGKPNTGCTYIKQWKSNKTRSNTKNAKPRNPTKKTATEKT